MFRSKRAPSAACRMLVQAMGIAADGSAHRVTSRDRTFPSTGLDDEDILSSHALFNLNARLAALELVKQHLCRRYAEVVADSPARWSADDDTSP
jgi:hypothetical protein